MPSKTPSELLAALVTQRLPVSAEVWGDFWDRLGSKALHPGEALAVLSSLTTRMPDGESVGTMLTSLRERNPQPAPRRARRSTSSEPVAARARSTCRPLRPSWPRRWARG